MSLIYIPRPKCGSCHRATMVIAGRAHCNPLDIYIYIYSELKVKTPTEERTYIGLTASSFKTRYTSHKASFTHREKSNHTELSKYIWKLKDNSVPFNLIWSIKKHARPYNPRSKRCNLCLWEKYYIITSDKRTTLNSRSEIISTCRHKRKYLLSEYG